MFLLNLLLALAWTALTGEFSPINFVIGFALAYLCLAIGLRTVGSVSYYARIGSIFRFLVVFLAEFFLASLQVAFDIVTPRHRMRPGVIAIPLDLKTDAQITLLANMITLTPGSLSLDVSEDRKFLYIHTMYIDDVEKIRQRIKHGFERQILRITE